MPSHHLLETYRFSQQNVGRLFGCFLVMALIVSALSPTQFVRAAGGFPLTETFMTSSASGWVLGGNAVLTSGNPDPSGSGWLRLTNKTTYQAGYAYYNTPIPTGRGLVITFDYASWGGSGADGLTFFLFDGATTAGTFNVGAPGGSLGYAQTTPNQLGLSNGYLGLGLDEFGNYSNPNQGRVGGPGQIPESVALRGPGNLMAGYSYLTGTTNLTKAPWNLPKLDCPANSVNCGNGSARPADTLYFRQTKITLTPVGSTYQVTVSMNFSKASPLWRQVLGPYVMTTTSPSTLKMGFAASTGGSTNYHEIRNLSVVQQVPDLTANKSVLNATTSGGSVAPDDQLLYTVVLRNNTSSAISGVHFTDPIPTNTTYVPNSAVVPSGSTLNTTSPIDITGISVPANGQATITFKVEVTNPLPVGVTQISNQGTYTYGSGPTTSQTDGDAVTDGNQATTIPVTAGANFDTSIKTVSYEDLDASGAVSPGDRLTYHVVLPNTGNQNSSTVTFTDVLPSSTTYVTSSATASSGTPIYTSTTRTISWTGSINASTQVTIDFKVTVNAGVKIRDVISNQGTVTSGATNVLTDADLATPGKQPTQLLVGGLATLTATKTAAVVGGGDLLPGARLLYTITLNNTSSYAISSATFSDTLPANTSYFSSDTDSGTITSTSPVLNVTGINLPSGSTATIHLTVQLANPLPEGVTQFSNQGLAGWDSNQSGANNASLQTDGDPGTTGQQATVNTIPNADLAVTKLVNNNNPAEAGTVVYTLGVTNNSSSAATSVVVSDALPAGLTYVSSSPSMGNYANPTWSVGTLASGASATLTIQATVNLGQGSAVINNSAIASSALYDSYPVNNSASASLTVKTTGLSGTLTDAQTGAKLANISVRVTDSVGHTCTATTDSNGVYTITSGQSSCLLASGVATVEAISAPVAYLLRSATTTIVAGAANIGDLTLVSPSLSGTVTTLGSGVPIVGATVTFTQGAVVCTTTTGEGGAYSFSRSAACPFVAGASSVSASLARYQTVTEYPTILSTGPTTQNLELGTTDLLIFKTDAKPTAQPGELISYVLTVENNGSITASGIVLDDTLPANLTIISDNSGRTRTESPAKTYHWTLADLAPGASTSFTLIARVASVLPDGLSSISNYAHVSTTSPEKNTTNNEVSDVDTVTTHPDLIIAKTYTSASPAGTGSTVSYKLTGGNIGYALATTVTITDTLDALNTYTASSSVLKINGSSASFTSVSYDNATKKLIMVLPDLAPTNTYEITYDVTVGTVAGGALFNTAVIGETETDLNSADNTASVSVPTARNVDVYILKSAVAIPSPAIAGGQIVYSLSYGNNGADDASSVSIQDVLDTSLTFVSATNGGTYTSGTRTVSWSVGNLASRATGTVSFTVTIANPLEAGVAAISNTASIATTPADSVPGNNSSAISTPVEAQPDLVISKSDGVTQVLAGDSLQYTITYQNTGDQATTGVTIVDTFLNGLTYVDDTSGITPVQSPPGTFTWTIGGLADFDLHSFKVNATVNAAAIAGSVAANRASISDGGVNGVDPNPGNNTSTDSDLVIVPFIVLEKSAATPSGNPTDVTYTGQELTYTIDWHNAGEATASNVVIADTLPDNVTFVSVDPSGTYNPATRTITWNLGLKAKGAFGSLSYILVPNPGAGNSAQTGPSLSTETGSGSITVTTSATTPAPDSTPFCETAACAAFKGIYTGTDGTPPTGFNDNPRLAAFNDTGWTAPVAASTEEFGYWTSAATLSAEWVSMHTDGETFGNYTFFRQPFCLPLNATGLSASLDLAGDDASDIYLNGIYLGEQYGAGGANSFDGASGIQSGINILAVQMLNNRHGGHPAFSGGDHSGLLFNLAASYSGLRPFVSAPTMIQAGQTVTFFIDENALGGRTPYTYKIDFGEGQPTDYQSGTSFTHTYSTSGNFTATVTARAQYGCTGTDQVAIKVLPAGHNLLANQASVAYTDANGKVFSGVSGAGLEMDSAANLSLVKTVTSGGLIPGEGVTYQLLVTNLGPDAVTGATVTDTLPAAISAISWACVSSGGTCSHASGSGSPLNQAVNLPSGATATYSISGTISPAATGILSNTATVSTPAGVTDLNLANNSSTVSTGLTPTVDLSISKTGDKNPARPGEILTYTILVSNAGPGDAIGAVVADLLPANFSNPSWTCSASSGSTCAASGMGSISDIVTLESSGTATYTLTGTINPSASGTLSNTATVTAPENTTDSDLDNNLSTVDTTLAPIVDLAITKSSDPKPALPGENLTYTLIVSNASGLSDAVNATVADTFPAALSNVAWTCSATPGSSCAANGVGSINDTVTVKSGGSLTYAATGNLTQTAISLLSNTASVNAPSGTSDSNPGNNSATDENTPQARGWISVYKFYDLNADGIKDAPEPALINSNVSLFTGTGCQGTASQQVVTDTSGNALFAPLVIAGDYSVMDPLPANWLSSTPTCRDISVTLGETSTVNFADYQAEWSGLPTAEYGTASTVLYPLSTESAVPQSVLVGETAHNALWLGGAVSPTTSINSAGDLAANGVTLIDGSSWFEGTGGGTIQVTLDSSVDGENSAYLMVWFDWNHQDSGLDTLFDTGETAVSTPVTWTGYTSTQTFTFDIPVGGLSADLNYRARLFAVTPSNLATASQGLFTNGEVEDYTAPVSTLPVTINYFYATRKGNNLLVEWSTGSETGNLGFNLYVETLTGRKKLNAALIPSTGFTTHDPQDYRYETRAAGINGRFYLEDVDILGRTDVHGPFEAGKVNGKRVVSELTDWQKIQAESENQQNSLNESNSQAVNNALKDRVNAPKQDPEQNLIQPPADNGFVKPKPTLKLTPTPTPTRVHVIKPTQTKKVSATPTSTKMAPTQESSSTPTLTSTSTVLASLTPTPTWTVPASPTLTPTLTPSATLRPTFTVEASLTTMVETTVTVTLDVTSTETDLPEATWTLLPTASETIEITFTPTFEPASTDTPESTATATTEPAASETLVPPSATLTLTPTETSTAEPSPTATSTIAPAVRIGDLLVNQTGIYRVTYDDLMTAGLDLAGQPAEDLALTLRGVPVPISVSSPASFGPGSAFEFYGQALDSFHTNANIYTIWVNRTAAMRVSIDNSVPDSSSAPVPFYMETALVNSNKAYDPLSTTGDPWYNTRMVVYKAAKSWNFPISVDHYQPGTAPVSLWVNMYGGTNYPGSPDHHVLASFNAAQLASRTFDVTNTEIIQLVLPEESLIEGLNNLTLQLPGDSGQPADVVYLDQYSVTYPRSFWAVNGHLKFEASGQVFQVDNLTDPSVVVYRLQDGILSRINVVEVTAQGSVYRARFGGSDRLATYYVFGTTAFLKPNIRAARSAVDIKSGGAEYLIIAHPNFIAGLAPLVQARSAQGLVVRVVDVFDIYDQFSYGVFDPQAIKAYIVHAAKNMGTRFVLLVGDDTYDYKNYGNTNSISFIPSIYLAAGDLVQYAPVDPKYADLNDDNIPDLALGRFSVRTVAELGNVITKTLAYTAKDYGKTGVFAADWGYSEESDALLGKMPAGWTNTQAYLDRVGVSPAHNLLLAKINAGVALTSFVGHSDDWEWTWDGLFSVYDAPALTNTGRPTVITMNGCWNIYYSNPRYETLADALMNSRLQGAAAMIGSTTLTSDLNEQIMGSYFIPLLTRPGMTIGQAMLEAKQALAVDNPRALDVLLGWSLLGDPALQVVP